MSAPQQPHTPLPTPLRVCMAAPPIAEGAHTKHATPPNGAKVQIAKIGIRCRASARILNAFWNQMRCEQANIFYAMPHLTHNSYAVCDGTNEPNVQPVRVTD